MTGARRIKRRTVLLGAPASAPTFSIGRARAAADFSYKFATNVPLTHPLNIRLQQAFDRIKRDSNGALEIALFPNSQLGGDTDVLSQLRSVFNEVDKAVFRAHLVEAGFYKEWRGRYGDAAWAMLEKYSGKLS
jgi:TRAP-type C4-dicarboxylate transport system substrate-binding protein